MTTRVNTNLATILSRRRKIKRTKTWLRAGDYSPREDNLITIAGFSRYCFEATNVSRLRPRQARFQTWGGYAGWGVGKRAGQARGRLSETAFDVILRAFIARVREKAFAWRELNQFALQEKRGHIGHARRLLNGVWHKHNGVFLLELL